MIQTDVHPCVIHKISHVSLGTRSTGRVIFMGIFQRIFYTIESIRFYLVYRIKARIDKMPHFRVPKYTHAYMHIYVYVYRYYLSLNLNTHMYMCYVIEN